MTLELNRVLVFIDSRKSPPSTTNPSLFQVLSPKITCGNLAFGLVHSGLTHEALVESIDKLNASLSLGGASCLKTKRRPSAGESIGQDEEYRGHRANPSFPRTAAPWKSVKGRGSQRGATLRLSSSQRIPKSH